MIMDIVITEHGMKRMRKRLGINARAAKRQAIKAFSDGVMLPYLEGRGEDNGTMRFLYNKYIYVYSFDKRKRCPRLVTVYGTSFHEK